MKPRRFIAASQAPSASAYVDQEPGASRRMELQHGMETEGACATERDVQDRSWFLHPVIVRVPPVDRIRLPHRHASGKPERLAQEKTLCQKRHADAGPMADQLPGVG